MVTTEPTPMTTTPAPLQAVLFDFDGTLIDSYDAIAASVNHVRDARGLPPLSVDEVRVFVGRGPDHLLRHTVPGYELERDLALYRAHHPTVMVALTRVLPGAAEVLDAVKRRGCKVALCSNKPRLFSAGLLAELGIADRFDVVLGPEDVARPKPAPDMLVEGLRRLGVPAASALYVGDMTVDVETARGAGVRVWVMPTGSDAVDLLRAAGPDRLCRDLHEVLAGLREMG